MVLYTLCWSCHTCSFAMRQTRHRCSHWERWKPSWQGESFAKILHEWHIIWPSDRARATVDDGLSFAWICCFRYLYGDGMIRTNISSQLVDGKCTTHPFNDRHTPSEAMGINISCSNSFTLNTSWDIMNLSRARLTQMIFQHSQTYTIILLCRRKVPEKSSLSFCDNYT